MTNEEKQLLLKDLCARLPYGVKFSFGYFNNNYEAKGVDLIVTDDGEWEYAVTAKGITPVEIKYIRYYLRSMSSMTEEEENEWRTLFMDELLKCSIDGAYPKNIIHLSTSHSKSIDWLNQHHFDYCGLVEKGLAIEVTDENNPYKE